MSAAVQSPEIKFLQRLKARYDKKATRAKQAANAPGDVPLVIPADELPALDVNELPDNAQALLNGEPMKDRSRALWSLAMALAKRPNWNAEHVFSWLANDLEVMDVARSHRARGDDASTDAAALQYLWEHHAHKAAQEVHGSKLEDADFEALAADVRREVQAMRDAPASAAQHRAVDRFAPLTLEELESARPTPRALIPGVMYCDTALLSGAGGLGKTTTMLHLAAATALGMAPFGHAAFTPAGRLRTVFLSREDTREQLAGRLARIMAEMGLSAAQRADVLAAIRIVYYGDKSFALTAPDGRGAAVNLHNVKELVAGLREFKPDLITLDPMGSWVAGDENLSADGQALVNAARALRDTFDCGVLFLAHPGKGAARAAKDMYSTRGSSAVPDGARLVMTLDKVSDKAWQRATGDALGDDETGLLFEFHKHTYSRPIAPLFVKRSAKGFGFAAVAAHPPTREDRLAEQRADQLQADAQKLHAFLTATYATGERHNRSQLEESAYAGMPRDRMRAALAELMRTGLAEAVGGQGRKGTHIKPKPADVTDEAPEGLSL